MSDLAEILRKEHLMIRDSLDFVGALAEALDRGQAVSAQDLNSVLDFMDSFTDKGHWAREEAWFGERVRTSDQSVRPLVHRLEVEHATARKVVATMHALVPAVVAGDGQARRDFEMYLRSYRMRMRDHIREETQELIPLIESTSRPPTKAQTSGVTAPSADDDDAAQAPHRVWGIIRSLAAKYGRRSKPSA